MIYKFLVGVMVAEYNILHNDISSKKHMYMVKQTFVTKVTI